MLKIRNFDKLFQQLIVVVTGVVTYFLLINFSQIVDYIKHFLAICSPIFVGFGIAYMINVLVKNIEILLAKTNLKTKTRRKMSVFISFAIIATLITGFILVVLPSLIDSVSKIINQLSNFEQIKSNTKYWLDGKIPDWAITEIVNLFDNFVEILSAWLTSSLKSVTNLISNAAISFFNLVLSVVLAIYMLTNKESLLKMIKNFLKAFLPKSKNEKITYYSRIVNESFYSFIKGQLTESFILAGLCYTGMRIFGFEYAPLISFIVGLFSLIPLFGPYFSIPVSAIILLAVSPWQSLYFVIFIIILQQLEGNLIYPRVVGNSVGVSPLWVLIGLVIGNGLFGFIGIIVTIPLLSVASKILSVKINQKLKVSV